MKSAELAFALHGDEKLAHAKPRWLRERLWGWTGALLLHSALLGVALGIDARVGPLDGPPNAVKVHLTALGPGTSEAGEPAPSKAEAFEIMERNLTSLSTPTAAERTLKKPAEAQPKLSEILGEGRDTPQAQPTAAGGGTSVGSMIDDPYSRASVSYRGDDPAKIAALGAALGSCLGKVAQPLRILLLLDANGRVLGKPAIIGAADPASMEAILLRVQRCGPITAAATPGSPRSYQIEF
jgi:hypothetical protein